MAYKKDEIIEAYKTLDSSYYIIDMELEEQYRKVLDDVNNSIVNYVDNPNNIIIPKDTNCLVMLLKYINSKVIKNIVVNNGIYNNYPDIDLYNILWDIYTSICYKLLVKPTILRFSIFTGINKCTFNRWIEISNNKPNDKRGESVQKWKSECESTLYDEAINTGNIGCIFALKANYGYRDNYIINVTEQKEEVKSVEEIAEDYNNILPDNTNNIIDF